MKLKLASALTAGRAYVNKFTKYYQYLFTGKSGEIVALDGDGFGYENYGTGEEIIRGKVENVSIAKFDGTAFCQINNGYIIDTNIIDWEGSSTPTIVDGLIQVTSGTLAWIDFDNLERIYFNASNGNIAYGINGIIELVWNFQNRNTPLPNTLLYANNLI